MLLAMTLIGLHVGLGALLVYLLVRPVLCRAAPPKPDTALLCHDMLSSHLQMIQQRTYRLADEIVPGLWLGNECAPQVARFLENRDIKAVVSMSAEHDLRRDMEGRGVAYHRFPLADNANAHLGEHDLEAMLAQAASVIVGHLQRKEPVLVHCQMGISRSTTAVVLALMRHWRQPYEHVLAHVQSKRPVALPNPHFERVLRRLEERKEL